MTTRVELRKATILGPNPASFDAPIRLHVELEVFERAPTDVIDVTFTWSPIWDEPVDQELDEMEVGPLRHTGKHELTLECDPPNVAEIPDPTGPTALIVSFSYREKEFLHLGFNVVVQFDGEELPEVFESCEGLTRKIAGCFPKNTPIEWSDTVAAENDLQASSPTGVPSCSARAGNTTTDKEEEEEKEGDIDGTPPPAKKARLGEENGEA